MNKPLLTLTASAFLLAGTVGLAQAQTSGSDDTTQQGQGMMQQGQQGEGMKEGRRAKREHRRNRDRHSGMMRHHRMGGGYGQGHGMGRGMGGGMGQGMGHHGMMQVLFAIMDANGDGTLSLEEVQETHARIFAHMDADDDGQVTKEEIKAFFHGGKERRKGRGGADRSEDAGMSDDSDDSDSDD